MHGAATVLEGAVRNWLGEVQPAVSWEVALWGTGYTDERYYTFTFHGEEGKVQDPTRAFQVYGLPGPAGAYALEMIWKESKDSCFHPMNQRWV